MKTSQLSSPCCTSKLMLRSVRTFCIFFVSFSGQKKLGPGLHNLEDLVRCRVLVDGRERLSVGPPASRGHVLRG